jgi:hypothetical protein
MFIQAESPVSPSEVYTVSSTLSRAAHTMGKMRDFRFPFSACAGYFEIRASRSYIVVRAKGNFPPSLKSLAHPQLIQSTELGLWLWPLAYIRHISLMSSTLLHVPCHQSSSLTWVMLLATSRGLLRLVQEAQSNILCPLHP